MSERQYEHPYEHPEEPTGDGGEETTEQRKIRKRQESAPKYDKEEVKKLHEGYEKTLIPADEVDVREDKYHTFHKICNTNLVLPDKKNISDPNICKAVKRFRTYLRGVLYCPTCDRVFTYSIEH